MSHNRKKLPQQKDLAATDQENELLLRVIKKINRAPMPPEYHERVQLIAQQMLDQEQNPSA